MVSKYEDKTKCMSALIQVQLLIHTHLKAFSIENIFLFIQSIYFCSFDINIRFILIIFHCSICLFSLSFLETCCLSPR